MSVMKQMTILTACFEIVFNLSSSLCSAQPLLQGITEEESKSTENEQETEDSETHR